MAETNPIELLKSGMALTGVAAVVIRLASKSYMIKTGSEVGIKARVDAGKKNALRKGNAILAQDNYEDILLGYDLTLTDLLMAPEIVALIDGGVMTSDTDGSFKSYAGPVIGEETVRTPFGLDVYCANKDTGSNVLNYNKLSFDGCKGKKPIDWTMKDGDFFAPKYEIESAPAFGQAPMSMEVVDALPAITPPTGS